MGSKAGADAGRIERALQKYKDALAWKSWGGPRERDDSRGMLGVDIDTAVDPDFHPDLGRHEVRRLLGYEGWYRYPSNHFGMSSEAQILFRAAWLALKFDRPAQHPGDVERIFDEDAFALWDGRRDRGGDRRAPPPWVAGEMKFDDRKVVHPGWAWVHEEYAAIMLLAVGAPIYPIPIYDIYAGCLMAVPADYAERALRPCDFRELPSAGSILPDALALAACLRGAVRAARRDPALGAQIEEFIVGIAGGQRIVREGEAFAMLADYAPALIACDWIEEKIDADIARNLRALLDWFSAREELARIRREF